MIIRGANPTSRVAVLFAFLLAVTACGGGGGGGGFYDGDDGNSSGLELKLYDPEGESTNTVTTSSPGTLKVNVRGGGANVVVNATTDAGLIFPASGRALTNSDGVATFEIEAGVGKDAGTITATATVNDTAVSGTLDFQIGETGLRLGYYADDGSFIENEIAIEPGATLSAGGNAQLSVIILDKDGKRVTTAEAVRFNSGCIAAGQATINPENPSTSVNGQSSTLYTATGCAGIDDITASVTGASAQAFGTLDIAPATANAVLYVSAEPQSIVLKGTGGVNRDETSDVVFQVVDGNGLPLQGITVDFDLSTYVGGLSLSTTSSLSGGDGNVKVTVAAGDVATAVRVSATVNDGSGQPVSTVSDLLTVTTGLPDADSISLSVSDGFVVETGMTVDGITRELTVAMADKFNNPVVDGTAAVFTTEYGAIVGSCSTTGGTCSVQWRSQNPRFPKLNGDDFVNTIYDPDYNCPSHNGSGGPCPNDLGYTRGGRSTILVHAIGEETFSDSNGNGIMDEEEKDKFINLPEAFVDNNEDGFYTPALPECQASPLGSDQCIAGYEEVPIDFNGNEEYDLNDNPAVYNGLLCPPEGDDVWCSRDLLHVWDDIVVTLSADPAWDIILTRSGSVVGGTQTGATQIGYVSDIFNSPPPAGSTVTIAAKGDCVLVSEPSYEVPNLYFQGAYGFPVATIPPDEPEGIPGSITITLAPTGGAAYSEIYSCGSGSGPLDCEGPSPLPPGC